MTVKRREEKKIIQNRMKKQLQETGTLIGVAVIAACLCVLLLYLTGLIPQRWIKTSCVESAEYFMEQELFDEIISGHSNTRRDNYADCILLNVMYHVTEEDTLNSLIRASYYNPELEEVNVSFLNSVQEDQQPDVDYFRYWHGSMVLLRPLFVLMGIEGARAVLGSIVCVLAVVVSYILWRLGSRAAAIIYLIGNLLIQVWMCLFCIEYVTTFLVMNVVLLVELYLFRRKKSDEAFRKQIRCLMAVSGVVTCFVDFLTTETLTCLVPLLFLMILLYETGELCSFKEEMKYLIGCGIAWGLSYAGMFLLKWLLAAGMLGYQALEEALLSAGERISGTVYLGNTNLDPEANLLDKVIGILYRNEGCLFPFADHMSAGAIMCIFACVCFLCFAIVYLFRPKKFPSAMVGICLLLGAVPYLRYLVLQNHSYLHYFFTYRAQLVTVIAMMYCVWRFGLEGLCSAVFQRKSKEKKKNAKISRKSH